jgi:hypothetical protein
MLRGEWPTSPLSPNCIIDQCIKKKQRRGLTPSSPSPSPPFKPPAICWENEHVAGMISLFPSVTVSMLKLEISPFPLFHQYLVTPPSSEERKKKTYLWPLCVAPTCNEEDALLPPIPMMGGCVLTTPDVPLLPFAARECHPIVTVGQLKLAKQHPSLSLAMAVMFGAHHPALVIKVSPADSVQDVEFMLKQFNVGEGYRHRTDKGCYRHPLSMVPGQKLPSYRVVLDFTSSFKEKEHSRLCTIKKVLASVYQYCARQQQSMCAFTMAAALPVIPIEQWPEYKCV